VSQLPSAVRRLLTSTPLLEQLLGKLECWAELIWYRFSGLRITKVSSDLRFVQQAFHHKLGVGDDDWVGESAHG
jgi:hypothetical protein